jgi:hypothetical protein
MYALCKKLTLVTVAHQLLCIGHGGWPVESCSESFTDQGSRGAVIAIAATVNFFKKFNVPLE